MEKNSTLEHAGIPEPAAAQQLNHIRHLHALKRQFLQFFLQFLQKFLLFSISFDQLWSMMHDAFI